MYIKLCDRCGRVTKNGPAFLLPVNHEHGRYQLNGVWFGDEGMVLCNNCLGVFETYLNFDKKFNIDNLVNEQEK